MHFVLHRIRLERAHILALVTIMHNICLSCVAAGCATRYSCFELQQISSLIFDYHCFLFLQLLIIIFIVVVNRFYWLSLSLLTFDDHAYFLIAVDDYRC